MLQGRRLGSLGQSTGLMRVIVLPALPNQANGGTVLARWDRQLLCQCPCMGQWLSSIATLEYLTLDSACTNHSHTNHKNQCRLNPNRPAPAAAVIAPVVVAVRPLASTGVALLARSLKLPTSLIIPQSHPRKLLAASTHPMNTIFTILFDSPPPSSILNTATSVQSFRSTRLPLCSIFLPHTTRYDFPLISL